MTLTVAILCNTDRCQARMIIPGVPNARVYASDHGWQTRIGGDTCPACIAGRGPVLDEHCPRCAGACSWRQTGYTCQYCGHLVEPPEDDEETGA